MNVTVCFNVTCVSQWVVSYRVISDHFRVPNVAGQCNKEKKIPSVKWCSPPLDAKHRPLWHEANSWYIQKGSSKPMGGWSKTV
jgi:hypothetical protein